MARKNRRPVKDLDSMHMVLPFLMNNRCDAEVYIAEKIDVTALLKYLEKKNDGLIKEDKTTIFHAINTAIAKTIYLRPHLNRYIQGKKFFDRDEISLSFVAKKQFTDKAEDMLIRLVINEDDNIDIIKNRVLDKVRKTRSEESRGMNGFLDVITKGPNFLIAFIAFVIKSLDYYGLLPDSFMEMDPNYSTVLLTNLGSIKCNQVYHHLNNYGTNSIVMAIGTIHKEDVYINETKKTCDIVEIGVTLDERVGDGFYFAKSIKLFKFLIENPKLLDLPIKEEVDYEL